MADRRYAGTPADFAMALGAVTGLVDEAGDPIVDPEPPGDPLLGWPVVIPTLPQVFDVYDIDSNPLADLLDHTGTPATTISSSSVWETAGQIFTFTVNDAPDGDVYIVGQGGVPFTDPTFRLTPMSDEIFDRLVELEAFRALFDETIWPPTAGFTWIWDDVDLKFKPADPGDAVSPVSSVNGQTGVVVLTAADVGAALAAHSHAGSAITSGTVDVARLPVGDGSSQVAAGNHTHALASISGLQTALDAKVNVADVAKVWPVIDHDDPTPVGAVTGDIIVRRLAP
ncbi:MAG TPA: hypothetical protein VK735_39685 [Pseudonocardia sp.]|uniref:hypothetical protein n=1 Tax=Pseudonocardia sp. TaxID=60912 RepID=UPI002BA7791C|nr:hypothetical protein [Pseudonocardia sp.]HTF53605.1 hypothetical protein [Pseudonocardia sp.]